MTTPSTELTLHLATAFGAYMFVAGLGGLIARQRWAAIVDDFEASSGLAYITGVVVFAIGVAIILSHNSWTNFVTGFISLVGWVAAIEGLILIAAPTLLLNLARAMLKPQLIVGFALFAAVGGALLISTALL